MAEGFLETMAEGSRRRLAKALAVRTIDDMRSMAKDAPPARRIVRSEFDVIAEVKHVSPAEGALSDDTSPEASVAQATTYAGTGAAAISVLTEPDRFGGSLAHLRAVRTAVATPVMRKDFLIDAYQIIEARAHGADGVLVIARILTPSGMQTLIETARDLGMFVLVEGFDGEDLESIAACPAVTGGDDGVLVGLNCRDLSTLQIDPSRFETLAYAFPKGLARVAESGVHVPADAGRVASLGYDVALVGTSLMRSDDPAALLNDLLIAGRQAKGLEA
ncbi:MAG: indole-3-glycerol phosphate synthase [Phycisphaerae bacterium]|nr:indole-3-glycerol phosphate synthase [Phycisphaerae bacterium]